MDSSSPELQDAVRTFDEIVKDPHHGGSSTCCILAYSRALGPPPVEDLRAIVAAYGPLLSSAALAACVFELTDYVAVILYCELRTKAFLPAGLDKSCWLVCNPKPTSKGKGRALSDVVKANSRALEAVAARDPRVHAGAQSPQRAIGGAFPAAPAPPSVRELLLRVAELEAAASVSVAAARAAEARVAAVEERCRAAEAELGRLRAAEARVAAVQERCRAAEAEHLRLRAEVQLVRALANSAHAAAQRRPAGAAEAFPRS